MGALLWLKEEHYDINVDLVLCTSRTLVNKPYHMGSLYIHIFIYIFTYIYICTILYAGVIQLKKYRAMKSRYSQEENDLERKLEERDK